MLHEFITANHDELVERCRLKSARRNSSLPDATRSNGVSLFLNQLADILRIEQTSTARGESASQTASPESRLVCDAAQHGEHLSNQGFGVDHVVHEYGDVCQSVTELALETRTPVTTDEFRTLNRCLDDAIAGAVAVHGALSQQLTADRSAALEQPLRQLVGDHQRLVAIAIHAYAALKTGHVGVTGATSALLGHSLNELADLTENVLPPDPAQVRGTQGSLTA